MASKQEMSPHSSRAGGRTTFYGNSSGAAEPEKSRINSKKSKRLKSETKIPEYSPGSQHGTVMKSIYKQSPQPQVFDHAVDHQSCLETEQYLREFIDLCKEDCD